jgi:hypothetical protein
MKIAFLDFDGTINPITFHASAAGFSKAACAAVQFILTKDPSVRIVISSAWRRNGVEYCKNILKENGIDSTRVVGMLEEGNWEPDHRAGQISRWLAAHKEVSNFVILDDHPFPEFKSKAVKSNSYVGLTQQDALKALQILCK